MRALARSLALAAGALACLAPPAAGDFGLAELESSFRDDLGAIEQDAGAHPFEAITSFEVSTTEREGKEGLYADGALRDLEISLPPGFAGDPTAAPRCTTLQFLGNTGKDCPAATAVGTLRVKIGEEGLSAEERTAVYNLAPPPGSAARLGFWVGGVPINVDVGLTQSPPYRVKATLSNTSQVVEVFESVATLWGNPSDPAHDDVRGECADLLAPEGQTCPGAEEGRPFLLLPRSCTGPLATLFEATSWWSGNPRDPGPPASFSATAHSAAMSDCAALGFNPELTVSPTTERAAAPSGLAARLAVDDESLADPDGRAASDLKEAVVTLPEGMTINPSQAEGLATCSEAELARETPDSPFGAGCPAASKIGTVEVETPLLRGEILRGQLFVAEPHENPFGTLLAVYQVIKSPELGIVVKLPGRVEPDPDTGQITATFGGAGTDPLPQVPFSEFRLRFREGGRSPLISPPCGTHEVRALLYPWAGGPPHESVSTFSIEEGPRGGACPPTDPPPFDPGFAAGTLSNAAGTFSPFLMRLTRADAEQDMTRFDAVLPPGLTAKLAGVPWCPEAAIARARGREGKDERRDPSCPAASRIGSVQGGAGAGSQLTYVPGKVYLAGPVGGAPISVVGIVPAVAGPFDVGTIVVRQALDLDPITGQAKVLSAASDPLPHILAGIPLAVRDIQVSIDRPGFTLNPTSCAPMAVLAGIWGGGSNVFSAHDDFPALRQARFQAAGCRGLGFEPKLAIKLKGGVRRGAHPALRAHVRPRPGDANFSRAVVTLPTSAFLEQAHIRTICTRVQFAAGPGHGALCPKGARYGFARAWSPLVNGPVQGPVYLRSSDNNLPDLVAALTGPPSAQVQVELSARIDSVKGGIRSTFTGVPDLPVSRFILDMQGGKKGLIVNSRHLCHKPGRNRAKANLRGQNGRFSKTRPRVVAVKCAKRRKAKKRKRAKRGSVSAARRVK